MSVYVWILYCAMVIFNKPLFCLKGSGNAKCWTEQLILYEACCTIGAQSNEVTPYLLRPHNLATA